jgi:hypothetical protein
MPVSDIESRCAFGPTGGLVSAGLCPRQSKYVGELFLAILISEKVRA